MKISNHKFSKPFNRKIHLNEKNIWTWRISGTHVFIRSPDGKKTITTDAYEVNGTDWEQWLEENQPKESQSMDWPYSPNVTPALIKEIILRQKL